MKRISRLETFKMGFLGIYINFVNFKNILAGSILLAFAFLGGWIIVPRVIQWHITNQMALSPDINPEFYNAWLEPPLPVYLKVYLFNVSNPSEILNGSKPRVSEAGPYVFQEFRRKFHVVHDDVKDTATYKQQVTYKFRPDLSGSLSLSDQITIINVPFVSAAIKIQNDVPFLLRQVAHQILLDYNESLFVTKTVNEILFQGWKIPFLDKIKKQIGFKLVKNDVFGFFVGKNDTVQGPFTVRTGMRSDSTLLGNLVQFENRNARGNIKHCSKFTGTDGSIFPSNLKKDSVLKIFSEDVCGSFYFTYNEKIEHEGISGFRFNLSKRLLESPKENGQTRCFCDEKGSNLKKCLGDGAVDLSNCRNGAPIAISTAHFLDAHPKYLNYVKGLFPEPDKHQAFFDVEPKTGVVVRAKMRIQTNLIIRQVPDIPLLTDKNDGNLFPLMWVEHGGQIESPCKDRLKTNLDRVELIEKWAPCAIPGIVLGLLMLFYYRINVNRKSRDQIYNSVARTD